MRKVDLMKVMFAAIFLSAMFVSSCGEKEDDPKPAETHKDAYGDVFVKKVKNPKGKDMYGLVFYAGGKGLKSCTVKSPDGEDFTLKEFWKGAGNMRKHPEQSEMKGQIPKMGNYTFNLTFDDGSTQEIKDELESTEIPALSKTTVNYADGKVDVSWSAVEGVDGYMVKLTDKNKNENQPFFVNKILKPTETNFSFDKDTKSQPGWMQSVPQKGETCYLIVVGIKYEKDFANETKDQNKQMNTMMAKKIVW